jgi:hypothetical protein
LIRSKPAAVALTGGALGWTVLAGLALLALGTTTMLLWPRSDAPAATLAAAGTTAPEPGTAPAPAGPAAAGREHARSALPVPAAAAAPADAAPDNALRGRLLLPDGRPAAARTVEVVGLDPSRMFDGDLSDLAGAPSLVTASTTSDAEGRFELRDLRPHALLVLHAARGQAQSACRPLPHTPGAGQVIDLGDVALNVRGELRGMVEDEDGEPVAGAEVWAADVPALVTLAINVERFVPAHGGILLLPEPAAGEAPEAFAARTESWLGRGLFQQTQAPGAGFEALLLETPAWAAQVWDALPVARARTEADGRFVLRDVEPGTNMLVVRKAGYDVTVKAGVKVPAAPPRDLEALVLRRGETCTGTVVDHRGRPVAGAAVRAASLPATGFRGLAFCDGEVHTDARGRFAVLGLRSGSVLLAARARADEPWTVRGPVAAVGTAALELPAPAELVVRTSPPGARLRLTFGPGLGELARMGLRQEVQLGERLRQEAPGRAVVRDLVPGPYLLEVAAPGHVVVRRRVRAPGEIEVALEPAAPDFDVVVVTSASMPLAGARVRGAALDPVFGRAVMPTSYGLPSSDRLATSLGCTGGDGRLRLTGMPAGAVTLWADHPAHGVASARVELPVETLVLRLPAAARVEGELREGGKPARPAAWRITATPVARADEVPRPFALAAPRPDGTFTLTGLEPGAHVVRARPALPARLSLGALQEMLADRIFSFVLDHDAVRSREIVLREGEVRTLVLDVEREPPLAPRQGRVSGRVTLDGKAAAGVRVRSAAWPIGHGEDLARTGSDGSYAIDGLREGTHDLAFVLGEGTVLGRRTAAVPEAAEAVLDLEVRTAPLRGVVRAPAGRRLDGARVEGAGPHGAGFSVPVDAGGSFAAERLPQGPWSLTVAGPSVTGPPAPLGVEVPSAEAVEVPAEPAFSLEVVLEGGRARKGTWVTLVHVRTTSCWVFAADAEGTARFSGLRAGRYQVTVEALEWRGEVTLADAERHRITLPR